MTTSTTERLPASELDEALAALPGFLEDWAPNHRELEDAQRAQVGQYIAAIATHKIHAGDLNVEQTPEFALAAWRRFRSTFDDLVGPYSKGPVSDFPLAMRKI